jgi:formiminotetrahydrofolate cyclodeaminase
MKHVPLGARRVDELLAAIGEKTPAPASGAAAALTGALAAALAQLAAQFAGDDADAARARTLAAELVRLGDEDAGAYEAFMADRTEQTRAEIVRVPEEIANRADEVAALAARAAARLSSSVVGDAETAAELARAAARVARGLARLNSSGS